MSVALLHTSAAPLRRALSGEPNLGPASSSTFPTLAPSQPPARGARPMPTGPTRPTTPRQLGDETPPSGCPTCTASSVGYGVLGAAVGFGVAWFLSDAKKSELKAKAKERGKAAAAAAGRKGRDLVARGADAVARKARG